MKKTYVIDTNVLIQSPYAIESFQDNDLVIPLVVVEELDGLKKADGEKGANARAAIRYLENLRQSGDLLEGVRLSGGGTLLCYLQLLRNCQILHTLSKILDFAKPHRNRERGYIRKGKGEWCVFCLSFTK